MVRGTGPVPWWVKVLAFFRISKVAVCWASEGKGPWTDHHDYPDTADKLPLHFTLLKCEHCGKEFYI